MEDNLKLKVRAGYLSGGEYKAPSLAMAYSSDAKLLLIDELSSGLFLRMKVDIAEILKSVRRKGIAMLIAEQDSEMARLVGDRIYIYGVRHSEGAGGDRSIPSLEVRFLIVRSLQ